MLTINYDYKFEETKDNGQVLKIKKNEKNIYIGSKYNSKSEVDKFLRNIQNQKQINDVFIVYGFGIGEHIRKLRELYENKILVFEPNRKLMPYIESLKWVKKDSRLKVLCCEDANLIAEIKLIINEFNFKNSEYISFSNYNKIYEDESKEYYKIINQYIYSIALDVNTKLHFCNIWFENLIKEIPYIVSGIPSDLYNNKFKNKPAIIVSAGPSLSKNINDLKKINNNMIIISGGRTLSALMNEKIDIDLLVIADSTEINYILVKDYIKKIDVPLLFSESANLEIVKEHTGIKLFYSYSELINRIAERKITHISTGGSVAHAMTSYAGNLGCNPIIFIGQDFAYTNDRTYSKFTENKDGTYMFEDIKRDDDIFVEDIFGGKVRTSLVLDNQRRAMEEIIKLYPNTTFINATEGGAKINGTISLSLKDTIEKYCGESFEKFDEIKYSVNMKENAKRELCSLKKQAEDICNMIEENYYANKDVDNYYIYKKIIDVYENNSVYKLLLYKPVYNYLKTNNDINKITEIKVFYNEILKLLRHAIVVIEEQINIIN